MRDKISSKRIFFTLTLVLLLSVDGLSALPLGQTEAEKALDEAENSLILAYKSVLNAERMGANISTLTETLNIAGADLTEAYSSFKEGSYIEAIGLAINCTEIAESVKIQAFSLGDSASVNTRMLLWIHFFEWLISIGIIVSVTFFVWGAFKKRYYRKILEMRPEVIL